MGWSYNRDPWETLKLRRPFKNIPNQDKGAKPLNLHTKQSLVKLKRSVVSDSL